MKEKNDGGPAFPHKATMSELENKDVWEGMSLRDWFAGRAPDMPSWVPGVHAVLDPRYPSAEGMSRCQGCKEEGECEGGADCEKIAQVVKDRQAFTVSFYLERVAAWSYAYADAMIEARKP